MEKVEVAVEKGNNLAKLDFAADGSTSHFEPGTIHSLQTTDHVIPELEFVGSGKFEGK